MYTQNNASTDEGSGTVAFTLKWRGCDRLNRGPVERAEAELHQAQLRASGGPQKRGPGQLDRGVDSAHLIDVCDPVELSFGGEGWGSIVSKQRLRRQEGALHWRDPLQFEPQRDAGPNIKFCYSDG